MNKLYIIGGLSRMGKGKIAERVKSQRLSLLVFSTDHFRPNGSDELAWLNLINHLKKSGLNSDVLIEGVAITPEKVHDLTLENFTIERVAFVGYSNASQIESVLDYAKKEKDWVYVELNAGRYTEEMVRSWPEKQIPESESLKRRAEEYGYRYFDRSASEFSSYVEEVKNYMLDPS